jgi:hypothetical protein
MKKLDKDAFIIYKKINEVIDFFDFEKVHNVMEFLNWQWQGAGIGVPKVYDLKETATNLIIETINKTLETSKDYSITTGGFEASSYLDENNEIQCKLAFVLEYSET